MGEQQWVETEWDTSVFDGEEDDNYAIAPKRDGNKALKWLGFGLNKCITSGF